MKSLWESLIDMGIARDSALALAVESERIAVAKTRRYRLVPNPKRSTSKLAPFGGYILRPLGRQR